MSYEKCGFQGAWTLFRTGARLGADGGIMRLIAQALSGLLLVMGMVTFGIGQSNNGCINGKRNGIYYTDCWGDAADDTSRLQSAVSLAYGKLIFNEYFNDLTSSS